MKIYTIDNIYQPYTVIDENLAPAPNGYFYGVIFHPSFHDVKLFLEKDKGSKWFDTQKEAIEYIISKKESEINFYKNYLKDNYEN